MNSSIKIDTDRRGRMRVGLTISGNMVSLNKRVLAAA